MEPSIDWTDVVHTCQSAVPTSMRHVTSAPAIEVINASIRNACVSGVFQIANVPAPFKTLKNGQMRVEVNCLWFGRKPPTTWMHITLSGEWELHQHYTGPVVENISRS